MILHSMLGQRNVTKIGSKQLYIEIIAKYVTNGQKKSTFTDNVPIDSASYILNIKLQQNIANSKQSA